MCAKPALPCRRSARIRPATRTGGLAVSSVAASADAVLLDQLRRRRRPVKFVRIGLVPARFDLGKLFLALEKLVDWLKR